MSESEHYRPDVWKSADLVQTFLEGVRGGIPYAADQIAVMIRVIEGSGIPVDRFLDLGSGSGVLAGAVLGQYPDASATLVDFSLPMLDAARKNFASTCHALIEADFGQRAWVDRVRAHAPYDVVVSGYAIHHQPDQRKREIYREIFDLLGDGGVFVNIEHVSSATRWVASLNDALFVDSIHAHHERLGSGKTRTDVETEFVHRPDKAANILAPVDAQCAWLRETGFRDVDCYFKVFELAVFGGRKP